MSRKEGLGEHRCQILFVIVRNHVQWCLLIIIFFLKKAMIIMNFHRTNNCINEVQWCVFVSNIHFLQLNLLSLNTILL